ncbi:MAG: acetate/propionate family kinase [Alphaproteobacteria bacterium]
MERKDISRFLSEQVRLLVELPAEKIEQLMAGANVRTYEPNEAILNFGEENHTVKVLLEGTAAASLTDNDGNQHHLADLHAGEMIGAFSVLSGDRTTADVIAVSRCSLLLIREDVFTSLVATHPPTVRLLTRAIAEQTKMRAVHENFDRQGEDPYCCRLITDQPTRLLVINCGSSSLKYNLYDTGDESRNCHGLIERIGENGTRLIHDGGHGRVTRDLPGGDHGAAFVAMVAELTGENGPIISPDDIVAVGHRVAHGGETFQNAVLITDGVEAAIEALSPLAPLHNPVNLSGIRAARRLFANAQHVAVFDTSFHQTLPPYAYLYGLPYGHYADKGIRRYGFHGMSHHYVALKAAETLQRPYNKLRIVSCHLGNGASACAIDHGRSMDTSMGLTPSEGLIMGTRSGTIDPAILIYLMRTEGASADDLDRLINRESGLKGLSGIANDMRAIQAAAEEGNHRALLAVKTYCYAVRKYIGAYVAAMGGIDALIFTGGIGQGSAGVRNLACQGLACMGIVLDEEKNRTAQGFDRVAVVSTDDSPVKVLVVPTDEERMIARETLRTLSRLHISTLIRKPDQPEVIIEVSAHHIHLSQAHVEALFGQGHQLTSDAELSQPGQFACVEQVDLVGPKGRVENVRVLGPTRGETQIEISMTEQFRLGIHPPIRESGDLGGTPGLTLEGPAGTITIPRGVICAQRHIHMSPAEAIRFGLRDRYVVQVKVGTDRELIFGDVLVRVHPDYRLAMHIDTDEANAAHISTGAVGFIAEIQSRR